jgi:hypothetical protein
MSARDRAMRATCHSPPRHGLLFSGSGGVVADAASYARARQGSDAGTLFAVGRAPGAGSASTVCVGKVRPFRSGVGDEQSPAWTLMTGGRPFH